jgi:hypothetical protein
MSPARLATVRRDVRRYEILDARAAAAFDDIADLTATVFGTPIATVGVVYADQHPAPRSAPGSRFASSGGPGPRRRSAARPAAGYGHRETQLGRSAALALGSTCPLLERCSHDQDHDQDLRPRLGGPPVLPSGSGPVSGMDDQLAHVVALIAQQPPGPHAEDGVAGFLQRLCAAAVPALAASGAGLSVMAEDGLRGMTTASDPVTERIEELQFLLGEGPCIDAFAARRPMLVADLAEEAMSWPVYVPAAYDRGVRAVFAFPLQVGAGRLGVLDVFRARPGPLSADELGQALSFAEVAVTSLLDGQADAGAGVAADGLDEAMDSRAALFQAQGMVMVQLGIPLAEALARMRAHAYADNRSLADVARDVVARRLRFDRDRP